MSRKETQRTGHARSKSPGRRRYAMSFFVARVQHVDASERAAVNDAIIEIERRHPALSHVVRSIRVIVMPRFASIEPRRALGTAPLPVDEPLIRATCSAADDHSPIVLARL